MIPTTVLLAATAAAAVTDTTLSYSANRQHGNLATVILASQYLFYCLQSAAHLTKLFFN